MGKTLSYNFFSIFLSIKNILENKKYRRIIFFALLIILFLLIVNNSFAVPTTGGGGSGATPTPTPTPTPAPTPTTPTTGSTATVASITSTADIVGKLGEMVDNFFKAILEQLAVMIAKLSTVVLAITALLFIIDVLLKFLGSMGDFNLWAFLGASLNGFVTFGIVIFLLMPSPQTITVGGTSSNITNYQLITMGTPDFKVKSLLTGFLEMGKQFFSDQNLDITKPSETLKAVFGIPFMLWKVGVDEGENIPWQVQICFILLTLVSLFCVVSICKDLLMAFITYVIVVGLSVILLPFLVFQKTSSIGMQVLSNIINKGLELAIRIGLVGIVISIISEMLKTFEDASTPSASGAPVAPPTTGSAFQLSFIMMIAMFIATEGSQVAGAVLSGKIGGFNVGAFIGKAVGKAGAAIATAYTAGKTGVNKYKEKKEKDALNNLENENEDVKKKQGEAKEQAENKLKDAKDAKAGHRDDYNNARDEAKKASADKEQHTKELNAELAKSGKKANKRKIKALQAQIQADSNRENSAKDKMEEARANMMEDDEMIEKATSDRDQADELMKSKQAEVNTVKATFAENKQKRTAQLESRKNAIRRGSQNIAGAIGGTQARNEARNSFENTMMTMSAIGGSMKSVGKIAGASSKGLYKVATGGAVYGIMGARAIKAIKMKDSTALNDVKNDIKNKLKMDTVDRFNTTRDNLVSAVTRAKTKVSNIGSAVADVTRMGADAVSQKVGNVSNDLGEKFGMAIGMSQEQWDVVRENHANETIRDDKDWQDTFVSKAKDVVKDYNKNNTNGDYVDTSNFDNMGYAEVSSTLRHHSSKDVQKLVKEIKTETTKAYTNANITLNSTRAKDVTDRAKQARAVRDDKIEKGQKVNYDND